MSTHLTSYFDAVTLSYLMHKGQLRRDLGIPYWTHVSLVSSTVAEWGGSMAQITAALGHDLVEDTEVSIGTVVDLLGDAPGAIINGMTASKDKEVPWRTRKLEYILTYLDETVDPATYLVKLGDMHANMTSFSNSAVRSGMPSGKENTINSYIVLAHICLEKLLIHGEAGQYRVAQYNIIRMFNRMQEVNACPGAELWSHIGHNLSGQEWFDKLVALWSTE